MQQPDIRRALVIQHERSTPGGHVHDWLSKRGAEQDVLHIYAEDREIDVSEFDLAVSLGSEAHAYDDGVPWLARELRLLRDAAEGGIPVLGICFGGQLLARALGGGATRAARAEIGWRTIRSSDPGLVAPGPWFQWHFDSFTPPPGARLIAASPCSPQAYTIGRSLGLQFHPEVTPEIVEMWAADSPTELSGEGVDPDELLQQTQRLAGPARTAAFRLFDAFLAAR